MQGYFNDDGTPVDIKSIKKPGLCKNCSKYNDPSKEIFCNLNRLYQQSEIEKGKTLKCEGYQKNDPEL